MYTKIWILILLLSLFFISGCISDEFVSETGTEPSQQRTLIQPVNQEQEQIPEEQPTESAKQEITKTEAKITQSQIPTSTEPNGNQEEESRLQQEESQKQLEEETGQQYSPPSCQAGYTDGYRCSGNNIQKKYQHSDCSFTWVHDYHCLYGCKNGKCAGSCQDTDGGKDYFVKGYIDYGDWEKYDECYSYNKDYLIEVYCDSSGNGQIEYYKCPYSCSDGKCNYEPQTTAVIVSDGDTFKLSTGETIRLIGLNAPETGQPCSSEATQRLKESVLGEEVILEQDIGDKDQYGRLLRYVYVDGTFINLEMVRSGLAHKYEYGSNTKYSAQFEQAENEAKQNEGCLWKTAQEEYIQDKCVDITNFQFNAAGNDNYNLNDEYVTFGNRCSYSIDMSGWTVKDETASHIYTLPSFIFNAGTTFTLYTGTGTNTNSALYWGRTSGNYAAIWNNNGDTLFLRDFMGNLVLTEIYTGY